MEDFTEEVSNIRIKARLINALNKRKPFRHFNNEVDSNEKVRQQWFKFKAYKYEEWVKDKLNDISELEDNESEEHIMPIN